MQSLLHHRRRVRRQRHRHLSQRLDRDLLYGRSGAGSIYEDAGNGSAEWGNGNDSLYGSSGNECLYGDDPSGGTTPVASASYFRARTSSGGRSRPATAAARRIVYGSYLTLTSTLL